MKRIFFFSILSGALLLFATAQAQHKYIYKPRAVNPNSNKTYHYKAKSSQQKTTIPVHRTYQGIAKDTPSLGGASQPETDSPNINDAVNVYNNNNPALLKASATVYFGDVTQKPAFEHYSPHFVFTCDPYYDYHHPAHIVINSVNYTSGIQSNSAYDIPLYTNSDNHWTVTYQDFVTKWIDAIHTQLDSTYWAREQGGAFRIEGLEMKGTINKVILTLQFVDGTKTIVWNNPTNFDTSIDFTFNQNFNPMP